MTCIVGIESRGKVWLGGDSAGTNQSFDQTIIGDDKVFAVGEFGFGVCGSPKVLDRLRHSTDLPSWSPRTSEREFLVSEVVPTIKESLEAGECLEEGSLPGLILVGFRGRLYEVQSNFQLITTRNGWNSIGAGSGLALGSLHSTADWRSPKKRIIAALKAACEGNATCRPPFTVIKV